MKTRVKRAVAAVLAIAAMSAGSVAHASDWLLRVGGHYVDPKSDNHEVVNVDAGQSLTFDITYEYSPHWRFELLAALPFEHDINLNADGSKVAEVKQLPPTLSVQYNFLPEGRVHPYVGLGVNGTVFFDESTSGALAGTDLSLRNSFGAAAQLGVDFDLQNNWFVSLDARWLDIDTRARLSGTDLGTVHIDPLTVGLSLGYRFSR